MCISHVAMNLIFMMNYIRILKRDHRYNHPIEYNEKVTIILNIRIIEYNFLRI